MKNIKHTVYLSATTTGGNAYDEGEIVELGAVKYKKGKLVQTFDVINRIENLDLYRDNEISCGKDMVISNGESVYKWLIRLKDFLEDSVVVIYDTYEIYNQLLSYGLELENVIDMKYLLLENNIKNYDDFVLLAKKYIKRDMKVNRKLLKSFMMQEIVKKTRTVRKIRDEQYYGTFYATEKIAGYTGLPSGKLMFSDGRLEEIEDDVEVYGKYLTNIQEDEERYYKGKDYTLVCSRLDNIMEDVYFENERLGNFYRAVIEGESYLITPTTLSYDANLDIELIYDIKKDKEKAYERIEELDIGDELREFFLDIIRYSNPMYEVKNYSYIESEFRDFVSIINRKLGVVNNLHKRIRLNYMEKFDEVFIGSEFYKIEVKEDGGFVVFEIKDIAYGREIPVVRFTGDLDKSLNVKDSMYDIVYDRNKYEELVEREGIVALQSSVEHLSGKVNSVINEMEAKLPFDRVEVLQLDDIEEAKIYGMYENLLQSAYSEVKSKKGMFIRFTSHHDSLRAYLNGRVEYVDSNGKTLEINNKYDLLKYNEVLYGKLKEHDAVMKKIFEYGYEDFGVDESQELVDFGERNAGRVDEFSDFDIPEEDLIDSDLSQAEISYEEYIEDSSLVSSAKVLQLFRHDGLVQYLGAELKELQSEDSSVTLVEKGSTAESHFELLKTIKDKVNTRMSESYLDQSGEVVCEDSIFRLSGNSYDVITEQTILSFVEEDGEYFIRLKFKDTVRG